MVTGATILVAALAVAAIATFVIAVLQSGRRPPGDRRRP